jgi:Transposase zinc-ribbon domain
MIPDDLPKDLPTFMARFGSDEKCRDYLFKARWPDGFRCAACGHDDAYALKTKIVYECVACGKQHSLLAGTIFEQTKTGLARWFLAIYLVTSSKPSCRRAPAAAGLGQLPDRLELAAQDPQGHGPVKARAFGRARRGR